jgi:hypothetical protein
VTSSIAKLWVKDPCDPCTERMTERRGGLGGNLIRVDNPAVPSAGGGWLGGWRSGEGAHTHIRHSLTPPLSVSAFRAGNLPRASDVRRRAGQTLEAGERVQGPLRRGRDQRHVVRAATTVGNLARDTRPNS